MTQGEVLTQYAIQEMAKDLKEINETKPTLRDMFAMQALSMFNNGPLTENAMYKCLAEETGKKFCETIAKASYLIADAMMNERKNHNV